MGQQSSGTDAGRGVEFLMRLPWLYNMRKGFIQILVWAKKNSSLDESKRKQTQRRRHSSILFGTTTYKAFKVRLRLFFSDFTGCCEWMP